MPCGFTRPTWAPSAVKRSLSMPSRSSHDPCACARASAGVVSNAACAAMRTVRVRAKSVRARNGRPGKVRAEDGAEVLPGARAAERAPLAHADAVAVPEPAQRETRESPIGSLHDLRRKIRTVEKLATRRAQHITNVVASNAIVTALRLHDDRCHAPRRRPAIHRHGLQSSEGTGRHLRVRAEVSLDDRRERIAFP